MIALYIRLSEADQDLSEEKEESNSISNQRAYLREFVSAHPEWKDETVEEFVDDGYSGTTFNRPAFQRMLSLIKQRIVNIVIVKDFSRFGRDYIEVGDYMERFFPFMGVRFIALMEEYDSDRREVGDDQDLTIVMKNILNSYYSKDLSQKITSTIRRRRANDIKLLAMPTTAGTGSEATRYAVIYYGGEKQSVSHESCIPSTVLMDSTALKTLPDYQKKSTMMDALCHAVESFWSVNSTDQSKEYSAKAIRLILENKDAYLRNDDEGLSKMLQAANLAGKAINITQTTAGHAMCYKLTSLYGIAHGHAAALCVAGLCPYMLAHTKQCIDARGEAYLNSVFSDIAKAFNCVDTWKAAEKYQKLVESLSFTIPAATAEEFETLADSVNPIRLKNNPVGLDHAAIDAIYHQILERKIQ